MAYRPRVSKEDLSARTDVVDGEIGYHDGSNSNTEGLYYYDAANTRWVKISTENPTNSVTIGI